MLCRKKCFNEKNKSYITYNFVNKRKILAILKNIDENNN